MFLKPGSSLRKTIKAIFERTGWLTVFYLWESKKLGKLTREALSYFYLWGDGIEIGALNRPLRIPAAAKVKYVDIMPLEELKKRYPGIGLQEMPRIDIIDNGEHLDTVENASQDFVIANHFLEHCSDLIRSFESMLRVLRKNGVLYLAIPDMRMTFDSCRPPTGIDHHVSEYDGISDPMSRDHFEEWVRCVEKIPAGAAFESRVDELINMGYSIHYHAWSQIEMFDFLTIMKKKYSMGFEIEHCSSRENEVIFVIRKT